MISLKGTMCHILVLFILLFCIYPVYSYDVCILRFFIKSKPAIPKPIPYATSCAPSFEMAVESIKELQSVSPLWSSRLNVSFITIDTTSDTSKTMEICIDTIRQYLPCLGAIIGPRTSTQMDIVGRIAKNYKKPIILIKTIHAQY